MTLYSTLTGLVAALGIATIAYAQPKLPVVDPDIKAIVELLKQRPDRIAKMTIMDGLLPGAKPTGICKVYRKEFRDGPENQHYVLLYTDQNENDIDKSSDGVIGASDVLELKVNPGTVQELVFEDHGLDGFNAANSRDFTVSSRGVYRPRLDYSYNAGERALKVHRQYLDLVRRIRDQLQPRKK